MTPQANAMKPSTGMVLDVEVDEGFTLTVPPSDSPGRVVTVTLLYKTGRRARLRVSTDDEVAIERTEESGVLTKAQTA